MAQNNDQLTAAEKIRLLEESKKMLVLAENVNSLPTTAPPKGWEVVASTDPPGGEETNGLFAKIYKKTGSEPAQYAVAFRGTDKLSDLSDLDSDREIAFRKIPDQYQRGLDFVESFCEKNGIDTSTLEFTGHSLGGYLARTIGTTLGAKNIWTFNAPGPSQKVRDELTRKIPGLSAPPGKGLIQIRSSSDIVSAWGYKEGITVDVKTSGDNHGLGSLAKSIDETIKGQPIAPDNAPKKLLARIFVGVAARIATSRVGGELMAKLADNDPQRKPAPAPLTLE